ncbi:MULTISPECIES: IS3 family transposase [unclassified Paenibacillus]|uniref:IS3 family transposase n=1 Tax=unclassified Paenibacillus TaxID=185978 RepID=UPI003638EBA2
MSIIGNRKPNECLKRWRAAYSALGESGPLEERRDKGAKGRKPAEDLSMEEQLKRAEARIQLFEAGNDFNRGNIHFYNSERYQWELEKMIPDEYRNHLLVV